MRTLHVVTYHYVRDLPRTSFPGLKGMLTADFRRQVDFCAHNFEMATLQQALAFLTGVYEPSRDLCMFTFDDGLKEHYTVVLPILAEYRIQGIFGIITGCVAEPRVAPVHMNHFLMAGLPFEIYRDEFLRLLWRIAPGALQGEFPTADVARRTYPLDTAEVAWFKVLFNFLLDPMVRDHVVKKLFEEHIADEGSFARQLYMNWNEIRELQRAGMVIAGHSHRHSPLAILGDANLLSDLASCREILDRNLAAQPLWPFNYPYGKNNSYSSAVIEQLQKLGFACAFDTEAGVNAPGSDLFRLHRTDCNGATEKLSAILAPAKSAAVRA